MTPTPSLVKTSLKRQDRNKSKIEKHFDNLLNHKAAIDTSVLDMIPNGGKGDSLARIQSLEEVRIAIKATKNPGFLRLRGQRC